MMPEHGTKIKGTVEIVARTNGIKIAGTWYNPHGKAVDYINQDLKGKTVELTMTGHKTDFDFIKATDSATIEEKPVVQPEKAPEQASIAPGAPIMTSTQYWEAKNERDVRNDKRISRHGAMNTAVEILEPIKEAGTKEMNQYLLQATYLADLVLRYTSDDKQLQESLVDGITGVEKIPEEDP